MKLSVIYISLLVATSLQAQPPCLSGKKNTTYKIKDKTTLYKVAVVRPKKCMDCTSGVIYKDSLCETVASFTIGIAPNVYIKDGYRIEDFPEGTIPSFKSRYERSKKETGYNFISQYKFTVISVADSQLVKFVPKDSLSISNEKGMWHYKKGTLIDTYKIIPQYITAILHNKSIKLPIYYIPAWKKYLLIKLLNNKTTAFVNNEAFEVHEIPTEYKEDEWHAAFQLKEK